MDISLLIFAGNNKYLHYRPLINVVYKLHSDLEIVAMTMCVDPWIHGYSTISEDTCVESGNTQFYDFRNSFRGLQKLHDNNN